MSKYLFGIVQVQVTIIEADDEEAARKLLKKPMAHHTKQEMGRVESAAFASTWNEFPGANPVVERDQVLAGFLQLMSSKIPFTPDAKPSSIIVPPGAIAMTEETKIADHESEG